MRSLFASGLKGGKGGGEGGYVGRGPVYPDNKPSTMTGAPSGKGRTNNTPKGQ